jgi:uncharacterized short protein YbdD (DUF466 family)
MKDEQVEFQIPEFNLDSVETVEDSIEKTEVEEGIQPEADLPNPEVEEESEVETTEDSQFISPVFNYYKDNDFFDVLGEDIEAPKTEEEFFELIEKREAKVESTMLDNIHQGYLAGVPDYVKGVMDAVINLPENSQLSKEQFTQLLEYAKPSELTEESFSKEEIAEQYIKEHYNDLPEETVEDMIASLKDTNKLADSAKALFLKDTNSKKGVLDKFVNDASALSQREEERKQQFHQNFANNFQKLSWREDRKKFLAQEYRTGNWEKRLEHLKSNPEVLHHLIDFVGRYNGKELDLDSYAKTLESKATKKVSKKIDSYFKKPVASTSTETIRKNSGNLDFDLKEFNL